ncbi:hypothetical protein BDN71DRAFT_424402 [Pleurotus eryngii]|uniref:Uncharacterized protein n=1 Tax=Pleurotus eryngii TaxID=5323 RepID=A0A9P5ZJ30_PLEER|nr:hypothetical protein BDN71DRAFT_424402 [Pleurotus eryngii]
MNGPRRMSLSVTCGRVIRSNLRLIMINMHGQACIIYRCGIFIFLVLGLCIKTQRVLRRRAVFTLSTAGAHAWGASGHQAVGFIAMEVCASSPVTSISLTMVTSSYLLEPSLSSKIP